LLTVTRDEVLGHAVMVLNRSDGTRLCNSHEETQKTYIQALGSCNARGATAVKLDPRRISRPDPTRDETSVFPGLS
jgi:hypothetical protein